MPELPEVETVRSGLASSIKGAVIENVELKRANLRTNFATDFCDILRGRKILNINRRAKYLLLELSGGKTLVIHLGMSGRLTVSDSALELKKHDHVIIRLKGGQYVIYNDARRFGLMEVIDSADLVAHKLFAHLGVEPLEDDFNGKYLYDISRKRVVPLKIFIMDQRVVVGVGNIYACEALFKSGISPLTAAGNVTRKQADILAENIKLVLLQAIKSGGSSLRDYVQASGEMGYFQHRFAVYGRAGEACHNCGGQINKVTQGGRSTFYCANCQS